MHEAEQQQVNALAANTWEMASSGNQQDCAIHPYISFGDQCRGSLARCSPEHVWRLKRNESAVI